MQYCTIDGVEVLLDAEWISGSMMNTKHETALANRQQAWVSTPIMKIDLDFFVKKYLKNFSPTNPMRKEISEAFECAFKTAVQFYPAEVIQIWENKRRL